jgi:hypothetical protein
MKEIKYTILYCVCENFCDSISLQSGFVRQKVTVTVPVAQHFTYLVTI